MGKVCRFHVWRLKILFTSAIAMKRRIRAAQECSKGAFGCHEVASELVRDIFEFFDLFFQGKNNSDEV